MSGPERKTDEVPNQPAEDAGGGTAGGSVSAPPRPALGLGALQPHTVTRQAAAPRQSHKRGSGTGCLLGVDIGTTGTKAIAFTPDGRAVARGYADYPLITGEDGRAELDSAAVVDALRTAIRDAVALAAAAGAGPVLAVAAAAQGEAVTPVDDRLRPLRHGILTFDRRGRTGCDRLKAAGWGERTESTGLPLSWIVTAAKLAHLDEAEPDMYGQAAYFLCYEDLLVAHLTGSPATSDSLAQRTWLLDRNRRQWDPAALRQMRLLGRLAEVVPMGRRIGLVTPEAQRAFDLPAGCPVVAGAHDQTAALIGAGAILPGMAAHSTGTVDCLSLTLRDGPAGPLAARGYGVGLHPLPGLAVTLAFGFGGGSLLAWARQVMGAPDVGTLLQEVTAAPGGAFAVPFWAGSGTPDLDAEDRGAFFGLTLDTSRADMVAALLRGMAFESRRNLQVLAELGVSVREARMVGGGTQSAVWNQIRADVTGCHYTEMQSRDAGCLGAAILAAVGIGMYRDVSAACDAMVRTGRRYDPEPGHHAAYTRMFPGYLAAVEGTRAAGGGEAHSAT